MTMECNFMNRSRDQGILDRWHDWWEMPSDISYSGKAWRSEGFDMGGWVVKIFSEDDPQIELREMQKINILILKYFTTFPFLRWRIVTDFFLVLLFPFIPSLRNENSPELGLIWTCTKEMRRLCGQVEYRAKQCFPVGLKVPSDSLKLRITTFRSDVSQVWNPVSFFPPPPVFIPPITLKGISAIHAKLQ